MAQNLLYCNLFIDSYLIFIFLFPNHNNQDIKYVTPNIIIITNGI